MRPAYKNYNEPMKAIDFKRVKRISKSLLKEYCPNCESADSAGNPLPKDRSFCIICSDPRTGEIRRWVWKWNWLHRVLVSDSNLAFVSRTIKSLKQIGAINEINIR